MALDAWPKRNLIGIQEDACLWRVFAAGYFTSLLEKSSNVLVRPAMWEDPFENFLGRCHVALDGGGSASLAGLTRGFFGQCWSDMGDESDATWRIYAPNPNRAVRVRVRAGALFDTIYRADDQLSAIRCFLGRVNYQSETDLRHWLEGLTVSRYLLDTSNLAIADTLLRKRTEFMHEHEVRLLFYGGDLDESVRIRGFSCDPNTLIDEILLDPRWTAPDAEAFRLTCQNAGYTGPILHSTLYAIPSFKPLNF